MADKLLIRAYDVGLGDCIYCRIPKARSVGGTVDDFHILVDCGSLSGTGRLQAAVAHLTSVLPAAPGGRKRLDLLVATHEHKDHILGFGLDAFDGLAIGQIWMNTAMDPAHPQAANTHALRDQATTAMLRLASLNLSLSPDVQELVALFSLDNEGAMQALQTDLLGPSRKPRYVHAGMTGTDLPLVGATIRVLGPEQDIDRFYLGKDADATLHGLTSTSGRLNERPALMPDPPPANISAADLRLLQSRMLSNALAFADLSSRVTNNTSVVLLIEWRGNRLLFVGDAEWDTKYKEGNSNGAWNVMWQKRKPLLGQPIQFLKIGHHGSENATPWNDDVGGATTEPEQILNAILPLPAGAAQPKARAIVSTMRERFKTIPRSALLAELGKRVANTRDYKAAFTAKHITTSSLPEFAGYEKVWFAEPQPSRTDFERLLSGAEFLDVEIDA
jgi:beta-lactamase superfamily II metal-dependent hydrolase